MTSPFAPGSLPRSSWRLRRSWASSMWSGASRCLGSSTCLPWRDGIVGGHRRRGTWLILFGATIVVRITFFGGRSGLQGCEPNISPISDKSFGGGLCFDVFTDVAFDRRRRLHFTKHGGLSKQLMIAVQWTCNGPLIIPEPCAFVFLSYRWQWFKTWATCPCPTARSSTSLARRMPVLPLRILEIWWMVGGTSRKALDI